MDDTRFDRFVRVFSAGTSRRGVLRSLAAGALGAGAMASGVSGTLATRLQGLDPDEQAVVIYEGLAEVADQHTGSCAELGTAVQAYLDTNAERLRQVDTDLDPGDQAARMAAAKRYGDRMEAATATIHFSRIRCAYRAGSSGEGLSGDCADAATPVAAYMPNTHRALVARKAVLQDSCNCAGECPMGAGWCTVSVAECILGGSPCECCWTSYCGSYDHCMLDCQSNECCTGEQTCATPDGPPSA